MHIGQQVNLLVLIRHGVLMAFNFGMMVTAGLNPYTKLPYRNKFNADSYLRNATKITSPSNLPYRPSSSSRKQLHSPAMRPFSRLEHERSYGGARWGSYFVRIPKLADCLFLSFSKMHVMTSKAGCDLPIISRPR